MKRQAEHLKSEERALNQVISVYKGLESALSQLGYLGRDIAHGNIIMMSNLSLTRTLIEQAHRTAKELERFFDDGK